MTPAMTNDFVNVGQFIGISESLGPMKSKSVCRLGIEALAAGTVVPQSQNLGMRKYPIVCEAV